MSIPNTHPDAATVAARVAQLPHLPMEQLWALWDEHFDERRRGTLWILKIPRASA